MKLGKKRGSLRRRSAMLQFEYDEVKDGTAHLRRNMALFIVDLNVNDNQDKSTHCFRDQEAFLQSERISKRRADMASMANDMPRSRHLWQAAVEEDGMETVSLRKKIKLFKISMSSVMG